MKRALLLLLIAALPLFAQPATEEMAAAAIAQDAFRLTPTQLTATRSIVGTAAPKAASWSVR